MNDGTAKQFGEQIKHLREERHMSIRGLAQKSGMDSGALTKIEHGKVGNPQPETLKRLAKAFEIPLADLFVMAGYVTPLDLPSLAYYLRVKYNHLPREACGEIDQELRRLIDTHRINEEVPIDWDKEIFRRKEGQHGHDN